MVPKHVASNIFYVMFTPITGDMIQFDEHIFADGLKPSTSDVFLFSFKRGKRRGVLGDAFFFFTSKYRRPKNEGLQA